MARDDGCHDRLTAERALRRARRHRDDRSHAEPRHVGPRPHRPAEPPAEQLVRVHADRRRRDGRTSSTRACASRTTSSPVASRAVSTRSTAAPPRTATATARTSPARSAGRRGASRRASRSSRSASSTAAGRGSWAQVIAGVDWVTGDHDPGELAVANMSLGGGGANAALETAVTNSIADGVTYALAAGNSNGDACNFTPARTPNAITLGATTLDRRTLVVLELRHVPRPVRAGLEHHVGVDRLRHRDEHDQRHVDGVAARRRRSGAAPPGEPDVDAVCRCATRWSATRRPVSWATRAPGRPTCSSTRAPARATATATTATTASTTTASAHRRSRASRRRAAASAHG